MDDKAIVGRMETSVGVVEVEQAIFTSIRSPMGQGYRLVAASSRIAADEKREIVQQAPSHGSLCDPSPSATGLASCHLSSGRRCIFLSLNAGIEQTARGGCRVHTHVLVLDPRIFRRFECDPLAVEVAARSAIGTDSRGVLSGQLEPLRLAGEVTDTVDSEPGVMPTAADADRAAYILSAVLAWRRILVVGAQTPRKVLGLVLAATPLVVREQLSLSYGLKFSPSRRFQLIFAEADRSELELIVHDHEIDLLRWDSSPPWPSSPFRVWLRFARRHWLSGRNGDLNRVAAELMREHSARALEQIATLCTDTELVRQADLILLDQLALKYSRVTPETEAYAGLLRRFGAAARARRAELTCPQEGSPTDSNAPV